MKQMSLEEWSLNVGKRAEIELKLHDLAKMLFTEDELEKMETEVWRDRDWVGRLWKKITDRCTENYYKLKKKRGWVG